MRYHLGHKRRRTITFATRLALWGIMSNTLGATLSTCLCTRPWPECRVPNSFTPFHDQRLRPGPLCYPNPSQTAASRLAVRGHRPTRTRCRVHVHTAFGLAQHTNARSLDHLSLITLYPRLVRHRRVPLPPRFPCPVLVLCHFRPITSPWTGNARVSFANTRWSLTEYQAC